ncbi:MAG: P-loop NTPase fold protein, partial [Ferruginibacter sp.]
PSYTFRNNGLGEYNDDVFDQVFDLTNHEYIFSLKPGSKTKFWRFGIVLSEIETFEFLPANGRYSNKLLKYIEIDVGEKIAGSWRQPQKIGLASINIENYEGHPKAQETYIENSEIEIQISLDSSGNVAVSYFSQSASDSDTYPIIGYNYFKIFAWADETEFEISCSIRELELSEKNYNSNANFEGSGITSSQSPESSSAYNPNESNNEPPSYNISKTKEIAGVLKTELNALIQKHNSWYTISENTQEDQFGNSIGKLRQIIDDILNTTENSHPTFNSRLLLSLSSANFAASGLMATYQKEEDKIIIKEFADLLSWGNETIQYITNGNPELATPYPGTLPEDINKGTQDNTVPSPKKNIVDFKTMRGRLLSDQSTDNDLLGFSVYSAAIAELIKTNILEQDNTPQHSDVVKPTDTKAGKTFNIGIIAPWGHGKTTLMKHVQNELDPEYKHSDEEIETKIKLDDKNTGSKNTTYKQAKKYIDGEEWGNKKIDNNFPSVWFNAWRYQSSEQIWAGLGHAIITQLSSRLTGLEMEKFWFKLQLRRVDTMRMRKEFYSDMIKKLIPWLIATGISFITALILYANNLPLLPTILGFLGLASPIIGYFKSIKDKIDGNISVYFEEPDYAGKLGVYHHIIHDLHKVFSLLLKENQRAVIFIDDLDRCSPTIIAEVFEAVNLMMIDPIIGNHCYFIFGMDAQVVAAALDNKYASMSGKLKEQENAFGSVGWYFLDKFIQLPFNVPIMSQEERLGLLKYYFETDKPGAPTPVADNNEKTDAIRNVQEAMKETNPDDKQKKLAEVLSNIDDKNIEVKKEAVKEAVKEKLKDNDSDEIVSQLKFISPFLSSSPREIIRYINL